MNAPSSEQRARERMVKLQQANLDLYFTAKRVNEAEAELAEAEREHSKALRLVEELEQSE